MRITHPAWPTVRAAALAWMLLGAPGGCNDPAPTAPPAAARRAAGLPDHAALRAALEEVRGRANGGFDVELWATVVDRTGEVVAVVFTGGGSGDEWPGGRLSSMQKANAANAFSLPDVALSTANLYSAVQPGGDLFGMQAAVGRMDAGVVYGGRASEYGTPADFMVGKRPGGVNVLGGGVALYNAHGEPIGALGVSGDAPCADHNVAWRVRDRLRLDHVPSGVSPTNDDNVIYDVVNGESLSGWGHPACSAAATTVSNALPATNPVTSRTVATRN
jgi:uncharacterized protein GlcG (DUF336 family)